MTVIEQISYLMFCRLLDQAEGVKERRAAKLKRPYQSIYPADRPLIRWSGFSKIESADRMLEVVRKELDSLHATLGWNDFRAIWSRVVRRIVLGDAAAGDTELTRHLDELRAA